MIFGGNFDGYRYPHPWVAHPSDCEQLARMRHALWPDASVEEHARDLIPVLAGKASLPTPTVTLVAEAHDQELLGFLEASLRSHADGCDPSHAIGVIEGWYVAENHRNQGLRRKLLAAAEDWARGAGCVEMASDTWIDNDISQRVDNPVYHLPTLRIISSSGQMMQKRLPLRQAFWFAACVGV
jgi:aminoglycoside 6'-N-acetyltransferase I